MKKLLYRLFWMFIVATTTPPLLVPTQVEACEADDVTRDVVEAIDDPRTN